MIYGSKATTLLLGSYMIKYHGSFNILMKVYYFI